MSILNVDHASVTELATGSGCSLLVACFKEKLGRVLLFRHLACWKGQTVEREFVVSTVEDNDHLRRLLNYARSMLNRTYRGAYFPGEYV